MEKEQIDKKQLVIIGGSSGSIEALLSLLPALKKDFSIPIILVLHRNKQVDSALVELMDTRTTLKVKEADEKEMLLPGTIYIAPPDYHLLVEEDHTLSLDASPKVNFSRPSIDVTFISAVNSYRNNLTAVLLSGANADGANAMAYIKELGGKIIVQDPADALVSYMPSQAIIQTGTKNILSVAMIAKALNQL